MQITEELSQIILERVVIDCMRRYQQKVNVGIQDATSDLIDNFKQKLVQTVIDASNNWHLNVKKEKHLFPKDCRFLYTVGSNTIAVIEQAAGIRTLSMEKGIIKSYHTADERIDRIALAVPYTVFVFVFKNQNNVEEFQSVYALWRKAPLSKLSDDLYYSVLPNQKDDLSLCRGIGNTPKQDTIANTCSSVIDTYWASTFNNDLSKKWWEKSKIDKRLVDVNAWHKASLQDSLFILSLPFEKAITLDQLIQKVAGQVDPSTSLYQEVSKLCDDNAKELFVKINRYMKEKKFDPFYPTEITSELAKTIAAMSKKISSLVLSLEIELNELEVLRHKAHKDLTHYGWEARSIFWE